MTQPNVSLHLKNPEQATRVKLVERSPFLPDPGGERLLQSAERAINELQLCQSDLNALSQLSQGTLAIAASDIISRLLLIQPFQRFKQAFPASTSLPVQHHLGIRRRIWCGRARRIWAS